MRQVPIIIGTSSASRRRVGVPRVAVEHDVVERRREATADARGSRAQQRRASGRPAARGLGARDPEVVEQPRAPARRPAPAAMSRQCEPLWTMPRWNSPWATGRGRREAHLPPAAGLPVDRDVGGVAAERARCCRGPSASAATMSRKPAFADPSKSSPARSARWQWPNRPEPVVDRHDDDVAAPADVDAVVEHHGARAGLEAAAVQPHQHRAPAPSSVRRRPHVEARGSPRRSRAGCPRSPPAASQVRRLRRRLAVEAAPRGPRSTARPVAAAGTGCAPPVGAPYGMPRKMRMPPVTHPWTSPAVVATISLSVDSSRLLIRSLRSLMAGAPLSGRPTHPAR